MARFPAFHMHHSGQYSINTEASSKSAAEVINERLVCKSYADRKQVTLHEKFSENDFDLSTATEGWTKIHNS